MGKGARRDRGTSTRWPEHSDKPRRGKPLEVPNEHAAGETAAVCLLVVTLTVVLAACATTTQDLPDNVVRCQQQTPETADVVERIEELAETTAELLGAGRTDTGAQLSYNSLHLQVLKSIQSAEGWLKECGYILPEHAAGLELLVETLRAYENDIQEICREEMPSEFGC